MAERFDRRALLRRFMVDRRRFARREELGLPPRPGDRGGISQEDLAYLINYGAARVGEFERGEVANPGPQLLDAIAAALRLTGEERSFLWHLAAGTSPPVLAGGDRGACGDDAALRRLIDGVYPHPALLMDTGFRLQAYNGGVAEWLFDPTQHPECDECVPLWMFGDAHARHVFVDWRESVTPIMIARIRSLHARLPADAALTGLIEALCERSGWARHLWHNDTSVARWPTTGVMRAPGHTDPGQAADRRHQVTVTTLFLHLAAAGDQRLLVIFQLPPGHHPPRVRSEQGCAACRTARESGAG